MHITTTRYYIKYSAYLKTLKSYNCLHRDRSLWPPAGIKTDPKILIYY